mgnify:CR=1 FL=1
MLLVKIIKIIFDYVKYGKKAFSVFGKKEGINISEESLKTLIDNLNVYYKLIQNDNTIILILECGIYVFYLLDYDGIIITYSCFKMIPLSPKFYKDKIQKEMDDKFINKSENPEFLGVSSAIVLSDSMEDKISAGDLIITFDKNNYKFELGKGAVLADGKDVTIVANGMMVYEALEARKMLLENGISASVINAHTVKPLDVKTIVDDAKITGAVVVSEEHNIIGGLGSAVAEAIGENYPVPVVKHGVNDVFGKSGPAKELIEYYGLNAKGICEKVKIALSLKR